MGTRVYLALLSTFPTSPNGLNVVPPITAVTGLGNNSAATQVRCCNPARMSSVEVLQNPTRFNRVDNCTRVFRKQTAECLQASFKQAEGTGLGF